MTHEDFCHWLEGYFDGLTYRYLPISVDQIKTDIIESMKRISTKQKEKSNTYCSKHKNTTFVSGMCALCYYNDPYS